ncbi:MAG: helix-turn-helix transcriptional regulator [Polyangia bacterium]
MTDLTLTEQKHVRTGLRYLRRRLGTWKAVAESIHFSHVMVVRVVGEQYPVSASMAFRVARAIGASVDELLEGHFLPGVCPRCGYSPDFADESTNVESAPRQKTAELSLVP